MKKSIKLYEATITNNDVKKIIRELKNSIKEHKKEKHSISAGMGMTWEEWDIFFEYFDYLEEELEEEKRINQEDLKYIDELNERIEKAVEYIEHNTFQDSDSGWVFTFYKGKEILLDILNGRSDE